MRILFIQLPDQDPSGEAARDNVPLAGARLGAYAEARGLLVRDDYALLIQDIADFGGDAAVCAAILDAEPDLALFHLQPWNMDRSLWIARRLRVLLPGTHIAAFGPETAQGASLLKEQAFDAIIEGEPEDSFLELIADATARAIKPRYVSERPVELTAIPDPYLTGIIPVVPSKPVVFELGRGRRDPCPYRYEPWPAGLVRLAPRDLAPTVLRFASDRDAAGFTIVGGPLLADPERITFIKALAAANDSGLPIKAEIDVQTTGDEVSRLWADAALAVADAPLPSVNPAALEALGMKLDRDAYERGVQSLWSQGISVKPGLILGLPQDSYETVIDGFDFLGMVGIGQDAELSPLAILPGTELRARSQDFGIREFLERPPYWTVETDWMNEDDFLDAVADFEESFDVAWGTPVAPDFRPTRGGHVSFVDLREPGSLDAFLVSPEKMASSITLLLDADNPERSARVARAARDLRKENPYCLWQIVLHSDNTIPGDGMISRLTDAFSMPEHYFELGRLYSLDPQPTFQTRLFFSTRSEALAHRALREYQGLETVLVLGDALPG
ncbi:MAG: hypothetical protein E4H20_10615, partial [Spirochaetales bacterium]